MSSVANLGTVPSPSLGVIKPKCTCKGKSSKECPKCKDKLSEAEQIIYLLERLSKKEIEKRLDALTKKVRKRIDELPPDVVAAAGAAEVNWMTDKEREEMYDLKMQLPSPDEEAAAASLRIKDRIAKRKLRRKKMSNEVEKILHDLNAILERKRPSRDDFEVDDSDDVLTAKEFASEVVSAFKKEIKDFENLGVGTFSFSGRGEGFEVKLHKAKMFAEVVRMGDQFFIRNVKLSGSIGKHPSVTGKTFEEDVFDILKELERSDFQEPEQLALAFLYSLEAWSSEIDYLKKQSERGF